MALIRIPVAMLFGLLFALSLFWLQWSLVGEPVVIKHLPVVQKIEFTRLIDEIPPMVRPVKKPIPPPPTDVFVPPGIVTVAGDPQVVVIRSEHTTGPVAPGRTTTLGVDRDPVPILRIEPDYPPSALRRGTEGFVTVRFNVSASGSVTNISIVDARPSGVFDEAVLKAVARWRYQPKIDRGVAVERVGLQTSLRFNLSND